MVKLNKQRNKKLKQGNKRTRKAISFASAFAVALPAVVMGVPNVHAEEITNKEVTDISTTKLAGSKTEYVDDVKVTSNGGTVVVGKTDSSDMGIPLKGSQDAFIKKYGSDGSLEWTKPWSGNGDAWDSFVSVIETTDRGFIALGHSTTNNASLGMTNSNYHIIMVKYSSTGEELWTKSLVGNNWEDALRLVATPDNGFLIAGRNFSSNLGVTYKGDSDAIYAKYDKDGNRQWIKSFAGSLTERFNSVIATRDGGYLFCGSVYSTDVGLTIKGQSDAFLLKVDGNGNTQWLKSLGGVKSDVFYNIAEMPNGDIIAVGSSSSSDVGFTIKGGSDAFYARYDKSGNLKWVNSFGGVKPDRFDAVIPTEDNGALLFGTTESPDIGILPNNFTSKGMILKIDEDGNREWVTGLDTSIGTEITGALKVTGDDYIVYGLSRTFHAPTTTIGSVDAFITRLNFSEKVNNPPKQGVIASQEILVNTNLTLDLQDYFTDDENDTLTYTATSSEGSTVTIDGQVLTFVSDQVGTYTVRVKANDGLSDSEELVFTVNVSALNEPPVIKTTIQDQEITEGQTLVLNASDYFEDPDTENLKYTITTSDEHDSSAWATSNGEIKFRSSHKGVYYVTVSATDGKSTTEPVRFKVTVKEAQASDTDVKPSEGLDKVSVYKEVINVPLIGIGTRKTLFIDGLLTELNLDDTTITLKSTDNTIADVFYNIENKTISFESLKKGFTNIQLLAEDSKGNKGVILYMIDVYEKANSSQDYIADGQIKLGSEAYVVELDNVYSSISNGETLNYSVTVAKGDGGVAIPEVPTPEVLIPETGEGLENSVIVPDGVTLEEIPTDITSSEDSQVENEEVEGEPTALNKMGYVAFLNPKFGLSSLLLADASTSTKSFVFEVPEGVSTTTLHEDGDLLIRLVNGKLVVEGKQIGAYNVSVMAETVSNPIQSTVNFVLTVLPPDDTDNGGNTGGENGGNTGGENGGNNGGSEGGNNGGSESGDTGGSEGGNTGGNNGGSTGGDGSTGGSNGGSNNTGGNNNNGGSNSGGSTGGDNNTGGNNSSGGTGTGSGNNENGTNGGTNNGGSSLEDKLEDIVVDIDKNDKGDLVIDIIDKENIIGENGGTITITDDGAKISVNGVEKDIKIDLGDYKFTGKRAVHVVNGKKSTAMHYTTDNSLVITTHNLNNLVITSRESLPFKDLDPKWNQISEIDDLYNYIITTGTTATTYSPKSSITRTQFAVMVARALELTTGKRYSDYTLKDLDGKWYAKEVQALVDLGIIEGFSDGTFGGHKELSRQQAAAIITRMLDYMGVEINTTRDIKFADEHKISDYAKEGVHFLAQQDILVNGAGVNFNPFDNLTRDQMAKVLVRALQLSDFY